MNVLKSKNFNIDAIIRLVVLIGFALLFFIQVINDKIKLYVHPRIVPYVIFAGIVMVLIAAFTAKDILKPQRRKVNYRLYVFFLIPLILAFLLPIKTLDSSMMSYSGVNMANDNSLTTNKKSKTSKANQIEGTIPEDPESGPEVEGDTINVTDKDFYIWMQAIATNPKKYLGKRISLTGFVFKDEKFKANEFVPARMLMTCCTADMTPVGMLANYDNAGQLKKDGWYKFSGKVSMGEYNGQETPIISIDDYVQTSKPSEEYIYPY